MTDESNEKYIVEAKERAIAWARERYLKRYGDDPNETQCKRPYCDMSGHPAMGGYCSCECEVRHDDEMEIEALESRIKKLTSAIVEHRAYCLESRTFQKIYDEKLWSVLEEVLSEE